MDREAWRAAVHGVPKNWTWLSHWTKLTCQKILANIQKTDKSKHHRGYRYIRSLTFLMLYQSVQFLWKIPLALAVKAMFLNQDDFAAPQPWKDIWQCLGLFSVVTSGLHMLSSIQWIEARDTVKHPTVHKIASKTRINMTKMPRTPHMRNCILEQTMYHIYHMCLIHRSNKQPTLNKKRHHQL